MNLHNIENAEICENQNHADHQIDAHSADRRKTLFGSNRESKEFAKVKFSSEHGTGIGEAILLIRDRTDLILEVTWPVEISSANKQLVFSRIKIDSETGEAKLEDMKTGKLN